jgi:hypothetical protein
MRRRWVGAVSCLGLCFLPALAWADALSQADLERLLNALNEQQARIAEQEQRLQDQARELDQQKQALRQQQQQIESLRSRLAPAATALNPLPEKTLGVLRGAGPATAQAAQATEPTTVGAPPQAPERPPQLDVLTDRGGVLTPHRTLVYEPSIEYAHTTDKNVAISGFTILPAITVGKIDVSRANHDVLIAANTFRYGLTSRLELEARVPYVYATDQTIARPLNTGATSDTATNASNAGLGDVEGAAHYQINSGKGGWPYLIGNLRFKSHTGTDPFSVPVNGQGIPTKSSTGSGFYNLEPSLTAIYPSDPAVFFGNIGYLIGFNRRFSSPLIATATGGGPGTVDPGNAIRFSFGLGFGINEASSFSLGYDYSVFDSTRINGVSQPGTDQQIGSVLIGYSYRFSDQVALNLSTSIGVTSDAPGTRVLVRVPISFQPF